MFGRCSLRLAASNIKAHACAQTPRNAQQVSEPITEAFTQLFSFQNLLRIQENLEFVEQTSASAQSDRRRQKWGPSKSKGEGEHLK